MRRSSCQKACHISDAGNVGPTIDTFNLTVDVPTSGPNDDKLVLSGNVTVTLDGDVGSVFVFNDHCLPSVSPDTPCAPGARTPVTLTSFAPVAVVAGQQVLATVVISFS